MNAHRSIGVVNSLPSVAFVELLAGIYEHARWVAEAVDGKRPFATTDMLAEAMREHVERASDQVKLALLRAHPDLAGKAARAGDVTASSRSEQAGAGLDRLSDEHFEKFQRLNDTYRTRFGFPFIIAVAGLTASDIIQAYHTRVNNTPDQEFRTALDQVHRIARIRLAALVIP
ncbi:MAG: 2-oxo-4-hydroxy-4-carboxy-5-ureidoimidazoline decarboxylase [Pseudomonadota bacterium]